MISKDISMTPCMMLILNTRTVIPLTKTNNKSDQENGRSSSPTVQSTNKWTTHSSVAIPRINYHSKSPIHARNRLTSHKAHFLLVSLPWLISIRSHKWVSISAQGTSRFSSTDRHRRSSVDLWTSNQKHLIILFYFFLLPKMTSRTNRSLLLLLVISLYGKKG